MSDRTPVFDPDTAEIDVDETADPPTFTGLDEGQPTNEVLEIPDNWRFDEPPEMDWERREFAPGQYEDDLDVPVVDGPDDAFLDGGDS